ncbi:MAG TPA: YdjY domain-containing protein [Gemmataceae bacterium]|jgi:hypothetical protein|nr:YdjY domain-containing protein [Gemmataceae bacterium]
MFRLFAVTVYLVAIFGCTNKIDEPGPRTQTAQSVKRSDPEKQTASQGPAKGPAGDSHLVPVGKNVWFENRDGHRRVLVDAYVCLRVGQLEEFLCRRYTKEHESILAADIDARDLHQALVLTGAEPGGPAEFDPVYKPAHGSRIKVSVEYQKEGKTITLPAQEWIRDIEKKKPMAVDWVFAGSKLVPNPLEPDKPPTYLANSGDVISISNFDCSLLDLPIRSTAENANLNYEAFTESIPALETKVRVILEPVEGEKGGKK